MNKINILTISGLLLLPFAIYQYHIGYVLVAEITTCISFLFVFTDNQKITGRFQQISMPVITLALSLLIESLHTGFPYIALALWIGLFAMIGRMIFIKFFSYARFAYMETLLTMAVIILVAIQLQKTPENWYYYFPAYVFIVILMMHSFIIAKNAYMLSKGIKDGYKAKIGTRAPDFLLPDQHGNGIQLSDFLGKRHVLLIFVRGDWCPYCHMIMRTYMRESHKFKQKDILLIAIGPDTAEINREMAQKLGLDYILLTDDKMRVAWAYGIQLPNFQLPGATKHDEGMPLPASFLIDKKGNVIYSSRTNKIGEFLDPRMIFPIVEKLK